MPCVSMHDAADPRVIGPGRWDPPGLTWNDDGSVNVALWAAGADAVDLCVFGPTGEVRLRLPGQSFDVFHATVVGLPVGTEYGFRVHGPWQPERGWRWNAAKLVMDPYALAMTGSLRLDDAILGHVGDDLTRDERDSAPFVPRSVVARSDFDWTGDVAPRTPWSDTVIYEAHVRGLTALHPEIPEPARGTFTGLAHPAVIDHLTSLGVTAVELLPVHHFVDEPPLMRRGLRNYWGYNTLGFFAPHAGYAARGSHGQQVDEFKAMVKTLHSAGLEVILDVVYNHTAEAGVEGPTLAWRGLANAEYYHLFDAGRHYTNTTGCGNTFNASSPRALQLILDSLRYWVTQMHVDGFRFDLATALTRGRDGAVDMRGPFLSALLSDPVLRQVKLIAEPWDVGPDGYQQGRFPPPWHEWNGRYRDCVRDFWRGAASIGELGWRLTGSADLFGHDGRRPFASINFVTAHDGFTLRDLVTYERRHNDDNGENNTDGTDDNRSCNYGVEGETEDPAILEIRWRQLRNFIATLGFSTGVPMLVAGDEFGRTQRGNSNAYCQDSAISWVDWSLDDRQRDLLAFTREILALRRSHAVLRESHSFTGQPIGSGALKDLTWISAAGVEAGEDVWHDPNVQTIGMYVAGRADRDLNGRADDAPSEALRASAPLLLILHAGTESIDFLLPAVPGGAEAFHLLISTQAAAPLASGAGESGRTLPAGSALPLAPRSMTLLAAAP